MDADEPVVQQPFPLRYAGFRPISFAVEHMQQHFTVVGFDVSDLFQFERYPSAVGDECNAFRARQPPVGKT